MFLNVTFSYCVDETKFLNVIWILSNSFKNALRPAFKGNLAGVQPQQDPGVPSGWMVLVRGEGREERIEANIPWFTQKGNKAPDKGLALFMEAAGALSPVWRCRAPSSQNEDAESLLDWVLEAEAGNWTQRTSVLQGISLKKREREREKRREREKQWLTPGDQASVSEAHNFIFKRNFYTLTCT